MFPAMKRSILLLATIVVAFVCACTREEVPGTVEYRKIVLSARSGDIETKSSRDEAGTFYWSQEDKISLFRGAEGGWELTSTNTDRATSAEFEGEVPVEIFDNPDGGKYWAIYPSNEANSINGNVLTTVVPAEQVAAEGTFADGQFVSIGCSDDLSMVFYHLCGGIKFTIEHPDISRITLTGNDNEILAGKVNVTLDSDGHPTVSNVIDGKKTVSITCEEGFKPDVEYFIVTLPVNFSKGFTVDFGNGFTRVINTSMAINRAKFQWSRSTLDCEYTIANEESSIENEGARQYLENVDYSDDPNYTKSYVRDYTTATDDPLPVKISWTGGNASKIIMSTSPLFDDTFEVSATSSPAEIYNLVPGVKYYYKVLGKNNSVLKTACVTPIGPVRMIYGFAYNVRDLGGWKADGGHVAYGKLFRGAEINRISDSGKRVFLDDLGIKAVLDLKGFNGSGTPGQVISTIDYLNLQVEKNLGRGTGNTQELYQKAIRQIIGWLGQGKPVYFHCAGGADRTGSLAFLIEAMLGVSESDLSKDYELTTFDGLDSHVRVRNATAETSNYVLTEMVYYLRTFAPEGTIKDQVIAWAKTRHSASEDPITDDEIALLRQYLIVSD